MSTGWTDRQTENHMNKQTSIACLDRKMNQQTDGQTSQAVAIVGWLVLDFYGRMLVSVATNAATILIAHSSTNAANAIITSTRGRHTCGCWLPVAAVLPVPIVL